MPVSICGIDFEKVIAVINAQSKKIEELEARIQRVENEVKLHAPLTTHQYES